MTALVVAEAVAIAILALLVTGLLRTQSRIVATLRQGLAEGGPQPPGGSHEPMIAAAVRNSGPAPDVAGVDLDGQPLRLATSERRILAFLTSGCSSCGWWWEQLRGAGERVVPGIVVVTPDPGSDAPQAVRALAGPERVVVMSSDAWAAYGVRGGSTFVVVEGGAVRGAGPAATWDALVALVRSAELSAPER